jgi:hypothetical protein
VSPGGPRLFARFAYPPNELGYCGPGDTLALLEHAATGDDPAGLRSLAREFEGAWPYLELIAAANGLSDPLDPRVVEAYWIGNPLLDRVGVSMLCRSMEDRFAPVAGQAFGRLVQPAVEGALPCHAFHVFGVYPWVGLLRLGRVDEPLTVLDRCRVRWGKVLATDAGSAVVECQPLTWDGHRLALGPHRVEQVHLSSDGLGLAGDLAVGDWCALHWDWVCDVLTPRRLAALRRYSARQLDLVNAATYPAPASVLG